MSAPAMPTGLPVLVRLNGQGSVLQKVELGTTGSFNEAWLQKIIHENPDCLPMSELEPGLERFTPICRELPVPGRGYIDNLLMTGAGQIALVETKLFRNPEARRAAVAQVLDYATGLFTLGYDAFEKAVLGGNFAPLAKPARLYDALPDAEKLDEAGFIDAVSNNLRRGRALILVVGDGIRSEAEALVDGLHAHARFGFTLALVELGVFRMPDSPDSFLVRPRTLAKTAIVQRTVVEVADGAASVKEVPVAVPSGLGTDTYWDAIEAKIPGARTALEKLVAEVDTLGVYPEVLGSLNLRWPRPGSKPVNMGYVMKNGAIWVDGATWFGDGDLASGYTALGKAYVEDLARVFGCYVHTMPSGKTFTVYRNGTALRLQSIMDRLGDWIGPMQRYITALEQKDANS